MVAPQEDAKKLTPETIDYIRNVIADSIAKNIVNSAIVTLYHKDIIDFQE